MPLRYDTEEELEELRSRRSRTGAGRAAGSDTEIALGTRSLLAIFFGLVLVCAIFFGLGYSVGRGSHDTRRRAACHADGQHARGQPFVEAFAGSDADSGGNAAERGE